VAFRFARCDCGHFLWSASVARSFLFMPDMREWHPAEPYGAHGRTDGLRPCQDARPRTPCRVPSLSRRVGTEFHRLSTRQAVLAPAAALGDTPD